jgi:putative FmdB family regulatory protein
MPIYEYQCRSCGKRIEIMQHFNDPPLTVCDACGGEVKKLISNTSFVLKGSGWYMTDYASGDRKKALEGQKQPAETKAAETKTETSPDTAKETVKAS